MLILVFLSSTAVIAENEELNPATLASILSKTIIDKKLTNIPATLQSVSVLPGFPDARVFVLTEYNVNNTRLIVYTRMKEHGLNIISFNPKSEKIYELNNMIRLVFKKYYDQALNAFYHYIPSLSVGLPSGNYDPTRLAGVKSLSIPQYPEDIALIKPQLLLVLLGPSDGSFVSDPVIVYYFGFETTGVLYPDIYTRLIVIVTIVVDLSGRIYGGVYPGLAGYYAFGESFSVGTSAPLMAIYGFIGIVATGILLFSTIDEEYKYYLYIFILYSLQIFSFLLILVVSKTPIQLVFDLVAALGQWFVFVFLLWTIPYILLAYMYHSEKELEAPSPGRAVLEGLLFAVLLIVIFLVSVNPVGIVRYLVAIFGPESAYLFIVFLSTITLFLGLLTGGLWAKLSKVKELTGRYPGLH